MIFPWSRGFPLTFPLKPIQWSFKWYQHLWAKNSATMCTCWTPWWKFLGLSPTTHWTVGFPQPQNPLGKNTPGRRLPGRLRGRYRRAVAIFDEVGQLQACHHRCSACARRVAEIPGIFLASGTKLYKLMSKWDQIDPVLLLRRTLVHSRIGSWWKIDSCTLILPFLSFFNVTMCNMTFHFLPILNSRSEQLFHEGLYPPRGEPLLWLLKVYSGWNLCGVKPKEAELGLVNLQ